MDANSSMGGGGDGPSGGGDGGGQEGSGRNARRHMLKYKHPAFSNDIPASKDVGLLWSTNQRKSVERINRVMQRPKAGTSESSDAWTAECAEILAHVTPLLAVLDSPLGATLVVVMPHKFDLQDQKGVDCIAASDLVLDKTIIYANVMRPLVMSSGGDSTSLVENIVFRKTSSLGQSSESLTLSALLTRPCTPQQRAPDGNAEWMFPVFSLEVLMSIAWTEIEQRFYRHGEARKQGQMLLPALRKESVYMPRESGTPLLIVEGTVRAASDPSKQPTAAGAAELPVDCEICGRTWPITEIHQHMGGHLLEASWSKYDKSGKIHRMPAFPCGICGIRESVGQRLLDPLSFEGCSVYISADGKRAHHQCKAVSETSYSLAQASKSSWSTRPCTNRPVKCPVCSAAIQSYSMEKHYLKHNGAQMSDELKALVKLRAHEREYTLHLVDNMSNKKKVACNNPNCECKQGASSGL